MVNCQIDKVKTDKALQSYISEIFWTLQNHYDVSKKLQARFFLSTTADSVKCAKFQAIWWIFANFQKFRHIKESGIMLES